MIYLTLPHNNTAHKHLNRPKSLKRHLALPRRLVHPHSGAQLILRNSHGMIDLVAEDQKRYFA